MLVWSCWASVLKKCGVDRMFWVPFGFTSWRGWWIDGSLRACEECFKCGKFAVVFRVVFNWWWFMWNYGWRVSYDLKLVIRFWTKSSAMFVFCSCLSWVIFNWCIPRIFFISFETPVFFSKQSLGYYNILVFNVIYLYYPFMIYIIISNQSKNLFFVHRVLKIQDFGTEQKEHGNS